MKRSLRALCWKRQAKQVANFLPCTLQTGQKPFGLNCLQIPHAFPVALYLCMGGGRLSSGCQFLQICIPGFWLPVWLAQCSRVERSRSQTHRRADRTVRLRVNEREPAMMFISMLQIFFWLPYQFAFTLFSPGITSVYLSASALAFVSFFWKW